MRKVILLAALLGSLPFVAMADDPYFRLGLGHGVETAADDDDSGPGDIGTNFPAGATLDVSNIGYWRKDAYREAALPLTGATPGTTVGFSGIPGLNYEPSSGLLFGTTSAAAGTYPVTFTITDPVGTSVVPASVPVLGPLVIGPGTSPNVSATTGSPISITPSVSGNSPSITWSALVNPGNTSTLPGTLQLGSGGGITGSVSTPGTWNIALTAVDGLDSATSTTTINVTVAGSSNVYSWTGGGAPSEVVSLDGFTDIAVGQTHVCGIKAGAAYCWGNNQYGQLGDGTKTNRTSPVAVVSGAGFTKISAGYYQTCGIKGGGAVYCWGDNGSGIVGNNTTGTNYTTPQAVLGQGTSGFSEISASYWSTCGLKGTTMYCWGNLSPFSMTEGKIPTTFAEWSGVTAIGKSGGSWQCLIKSGTSYCWGGGIADDYVKVIPSDKWKSYGSAFTKIATSGTYGCGLRSTGKIACWGTNSNGQLGDGTTTNRTSAVTVQGTQTYVDLALSYTHTCGLTNAKEVYCWGAGFGSTPVLRSGLPNDLVALSGGTGNMGTFALR